MSIYTHANKDHTIFKTEDGRYINYRGCDISNFVHKLKPQQYIPLLSQPKFYLVVEEWDEEEEQYLPVSIHGPYDTKDCRNLLKNEYMLLATEQAVEDFKLFNGLIEANFVIF